MKAHFQKVKDFWIYLSQTARPGSRGVDLIILAFVWIVVGASILLYGDPDPAHKVPIEYLGELTRSMVWFVAAAISLVTAWWPPQRDRYGYTALIFPAGLRTLSYITAVPMGYLTDNQVGYTGAWFDALSWSLVTMFVYRLATRPELPHPRHPREPGEMHLS